MATLTHSITETWADSGERIEKTNDYTAGAVQRLSESCPGSTETELVIAIDVSEIKVLYINSTQDVTLNTNAADPGGTDTINLTANKPLVWTSDSYYANPLITGDVTSIFIDVAGATAATFDLRVMTDPTP